MESLQVYEEQGERHRVLGRHRPAPRWIAESFGWREMICLSV